MLLILNATFPAEVQTGTY